MSVNLKIDNPVIAIMGPESAVGWGPCQFPALKKMPDGRLVLQYHVGQDSCEEYGKGSGWLISDDNGDSWRDVSPEEMPMVIGFSGTKLPSGKYIRIITPPNHPVDKDFYKAYPNRGRIGENLGSGCGWSLPAEELPQDLFPMGWQYGIYDPSTGEDETYFCDLDYPGMNIHFLNSGSLVRPFPYQNLCVAPDGTLLDCFEGREINPGHDLEALWFMMNLGIRRNDKALIDKCVEIALSVIDFGWDKEYGGIFYFQDSKGAPMQKLEWDQKLWWVHLESAICMIKGYQLTGNKMCLDWFMKLHDYMWTHFKDEQYPEWYGYLNRRGEVLLTLKGGKWKGCFHVPRGLYQIWQILETL